MEIKLLVTLALSNEFAGLLTSLINGASAPVADKPKAAAPKVEEKTEATVKSIAPAAKATPAPAPKATAAPKATPAPKTAAPKASPAPAAKAEGVDFAGLDDDAKLEEIKTHVTRHSKKGKTADIKALLSHFEADRASNLAVEQYDDFYEMIVRFGKGESVEDILASGEDLA